jgi:hypothetical protein
VESAHEAGGGCSGSVMQVAYDMSQPACLLLVFLLSLINCTGLLWRQTCGAAWGKLGDCRPHCKAAYVQELVSKGAAARVCQVQVLCARHVRDRTAALSLYGISLVCWLLWCCAAKLQCRQAVGSLPLAGSV